ncbi:DMT family transporter [Cognatishimia sp. F0-27]|nr:DMT family transporter [Cognatishimia sp. F0-27]
MLCFSALVAGSFALGGMAAPFVDPAALTALRFALSAAMLWAVALAMGQVDARVLAAPWRYAVLAGLYALYFVLMFEGLKTADPVSMAAVFTLNPALTACFGWLVLRQVTSPWMAGAIAVGATGAIWVIFEADLAALRAFEIGRGEFVYFWGCVGHALYIPLIAKLSRGEPALAFSAAVLTAGALILFVWAWEAIRSTDWMAMPGIVWITLIYVAVAATGLTFLILRYAALRIPSAKVMAYTYLTPTWVIGWQAALGHGVPPALVLPGIALTCVALLMLLRNR